MRELLTAGIKTSGSSVDVAGHESGDGVLPDISGILDTQTPLPEYKDKVEDSIQFSDNI